MTTNQRLYSGVNLYEDAYYSSYFSKGFNTQPVAIHQGIKQDLLKNQVNTHLEFDSCVQYEEDSYDSMSDTEDISDSEYEESLFTSLEVDCEEYYFYEDRFFTFDEAQNVYYALLRER